MGRTKPAQDRRTGKLWWCPLLLAFLASLVACGRQVEITAPTPASAERAAVGKTIEARGWTLTLIDLPQKLESIGGGEGWDAYDEHHSGTWEPEGVYITVPVRVANGEEEEERLLPGTLFKVIDAQGNEFSAAPRLPTVTYVFTTERWMSDDNQLGGTVYDPGTTLEGPILFDVPVNAKGLSLTATETEDSIDLGF